MSLALVQPMSIEPMLLPAALESMDSVPFGVNPVRVSVLVLGELTLVVLIVVELDEILP
jgi:hypothetical protein